MGDWQHSSHKGVAACSFAEKARAAEIAIFVEDCLPQLVDVARKFGYALAVHGTRRRDLDLIAVPWTDDAAAPEKLIDAIALVTGTLTGWGHKKAGDWTKKPHGRVATTIIASAEVHLDISVMPRAPKDEVEE